MADWFDETQVASVAGLSDLGSEPKPATHPGLVRDDTGSVTIELRGGAVESVRVAEALLRDHRGLERCLRDAVERLLATTGADAAGTALLESRDEIRRGQEHLARLETLHRESMSRGRDFLDERAARSRAEEGGLPWP